MDSGCLELSLSLKPCYVPQGISNILKDVFKIHNISDRLLVLNEYLQKYQEELSRLKDFQNELPQCVLLLLDAIEKLEEEVTKTNSAMPAMEFLPKKSTEMLKMETFEKYSKEGNNIFKTSFPRLQPCKARIGEDAALTMRRCPTIPELSSMTAKARKPGKRIQALNALSNAKWGNRKISWKQPLHDRFVAAVELLGGPEVATPKRIKKLMKVEELTRDHIKSHLQKYRIEKRKAPAASTLLS